MTYPWYWVTPPPPPGPPAPKVNDPEEKVGKQNDNNGNNVDDVQGNGDPKPQPGKPQPPMGPTITPEELARLRRKAANEALLEWWNNSPGWRKALERALQYGMTGNGVQAGSSGGPENYWPHSSFWNDYYRCQESDRAFYEFIGSGVNKLGQLLGAGYGDKAINIYTQKYADTGNYVYVVGGGVAHAWNSDNWLTTASIFGAGWSVSGWAVSTKIGWKGGEVTLTKQGANSPFFRLDPKGHYHRRPGIGKHRPWEGGP